MAYIRTSERLSGNPSCGQQWLPGWGKGVGFVEPDEDSVPDAEMFLVYALRMWHC
ncbi:hypothetical protein [Streptomyces acidiscabies]|uniref:hypothetical protein n=1 Tax=Streptomyces acidiscabies TaxID=42234 RepID=UPI0038F77EE6